MSLIAFNFDDGSMYSIDNISKTQSLWLNWIVLYVFLKGSNNVCQVVKGLNMP